jgi:DNA-binding beta-propeller fold protein YncE
MPMTKFWHSVRARVRFSAVLSHPGAACLLVAGLTSGCFSTGGGVDPPLDELYHPVGVTLGRDGDLLYVANNDADLRYNGGTVQVLDAKTLRKALPQWCQSDDNCVARETCDGEATGLLGVCRRDGVPSCQGSEEDISLQTPAVCGVVELELDTNVLAGVRTAPGSTDIRRVTLTDGGQTRHRLLVPVRGDATLHWMDVEAKSGRAKVIDCGQGDNHSCDTKHRVGGEDARAPDGSKVPPEPAGIGVSPDGRTILMGHQTRAAVSLFTNGRSGPELQEVVRGLGVSPIALAPLPMRHDDPTHRGDFLLTYVHSRETQRPYVELLSVWSWPEDNDAAGGFVQRAGRAYFTASQSGLDSRGIVVDSFERQVCQDACECTVASDCEACSAACREVPLSVYVASRSPDALLVGQTSTEGEPQQGTLLPNFTQAVSLRGEPSRLVSSSLIDEFGRVVPRVMVLSVTTGSETIYDPVAGQVEARVIVGRGPQSIAVDSDRGLAYVALFNDSSIAVVDLDKRRSTFAQVLLLIGRPSLSSSG